MKLPGERNWWAPAPLWRFYQRFGLREAPIAPSSDERDVDVSASAGVVNRDVEAETVGAGAGIMGR